ncbi:MAG TPA: alpha-ketoacid dehydrogenase subunit beta [Candidatus Limnocylindria bacterium]|nr:alpha-ketoacid dehydrogenase subunit beta [Candidatus Limnocylindria bacterium]
MPEQTFLDAVQLGLAEEMRRDPDVYIFGEDVALGGPFGVTQGLAEEFGVHRMVNTPISEGTVMGLAIGAATAGLRPVVEIMFIDFITLAMDQLVNHAAKLHYMSGGQLRIPLTVRVQCGISGAMGAHHSQSLEAWLAHVPGLKVVMPSNPADAKGLLKAAIRDDNPVVFIEHRGLYWSKAPVPDGDVAVPIGQAAVLRRGEQITIVALANMVGPALAAAEELASTGIAAEIIDPRTISPLDIATIASSVKKTSRLIVVHEAVEHGGIGAEIVARVQQEVFYYLDSPIIRVAGPFAPIPAGPSLEKAFLPTAEQIVAAARRAIG